MRYNIRLTILAVVLHIASLSLASAQANDVVEDNEVPDPEDDICGEIVRIDNQDDSGPWFFASDVYDCMTSVPFNDAVATRFLEYYNETIQFQSTIGTLKHPPESYRQDPIDLVAGLNTIQEKISTGEFRNQYAFEHELQSLLLKTHDAHVILYAGVLGQFSFGSLYDLVTLSDDGIKPPKVYVWDDVQNCTSRQECDVSAVKTINNVTAEQFLTEFAKNQSIGLVEPNADWNQLMLSPALTVQGGLTTFAGNAQLYPGYDFDDELDIVLENGDDSYSYYWLSLYHSPGYTGPLRTGGDFYNYFVLGLAPPSYNDSTPEYLEWYNNNTNADEDALLDDAKPLTSWHSLSPAYPNSPVVVEEEFGLFGAGSVSGYVLEHISTAVLSIPTFDGDIVTFAEALERFTTAAQNMSKIVIDLQRNDGGDIDLALIAFARFFPGVVPFTGSRMRAHSAANALGEALTGRFMNTSPTSDDEYEDLLASEWVVTDRINAQTGRNFSSWAEYFGPLQEHDDLFALTQEYNLTDGLFDSWNLGADFSDIFDTSATKPDVPWSAEDIVILTDGLCSSACTFFVELMKQQLGVRTVVVGGQPAPGPMQAASGTRGAAAYSSDSLDDDFNQAVGIDTTIRDRLPIRGTSNDTGMLITYAGFTLRDQVRKNATIANQFLYLPADCRLYWTFDNFNNYTRLWQDAWSAIYNDTSKCVPGSTGIADSDGHVNLTSRSTRRSPTTSYELSDAILNGITLHPDISSGGVQDEQDVSNFPMLCGPSTADNKQCPVNTACRRVRNYCKECKPCERKYKEEFRCLEKTSGWQNFCHNDHCTNIPTGETPNSKVNAPNFSKKQKEPKPAPQIVQGYCYPTRQLWTAITCKQLDDNWSQYEKGD